MCKFGRDKDHNTNRRCGLIQVIGSTGRKLLFICLFSLDGYVMRSSQLYVTTAYCCNVSTVYSVYATGCSRWALVHTVFRASN